MMNSDLMNGAMFDSTNVETSLNLETTNVVFNGFSLTGLCTGVENTLVQTANHRNLSQIELKTYDLPRINGGIVLGKKYSKKVIELTMFIRADSNNELEDMIDTLKVNTATTNGVLDFNFGTSRRQLNCTLVSMEIPNFSKLDTVIDGIKLSFESYDPNFRDAVQSNRVFTGVAADMTDSLINIGTDDSIPSYYLLFQTGIAGLTSVSISLGGYIISIAETITDSDILIFDGSTFTVTLNGVEIEYTGIFAELPVGETPIIITFTPASTVDVDINIFWNKNYL